MDTNLYSRLTSDPYVEPLIGKLRAFEPDAPLVLRENDSPYWSSDGSLSPILTCTHDALRQAHNVLHHPACQPNRVEILWDRGTSRFHSDVRGMLLYQNTKFVVHVLHALIGYIGAGPTLTKNILVMLGVTEAQFDEVNQQVQNRSAAVVFTRADDGAWSWESH
jgi:hypothetical protein